MHTRRRIWSRRTEEGASAVEYGLLVSLIAAAIVLAAFAFGDTVRTLFSDTCDTYQTSSGQSGQDCDG